MVLLVNKPSRLLILTLARFKESSPARGMCGHSCSRRSPRLPCRRRPGRSHWKGFLSRHTSMLKKTANAAAAAASAATIVVVAVVIVVSECYQCLTAHQHQKGHTVPKQVITIATSIQVTTVYALHCVRAFAIRQSLNKMSDKT